MREFNRIIFGRNFGFAKEWDKSHRKWVIEFTEEELTLFIDRLESLNSQQENQTDASELTPQKRFDGTADTSSSPNTRDVKE